MKRKFCWLPTPVYSSVYYRCGFRWFKWAWVGDDGKAYTSYQGKIKAKFNSDGRLLLLVIPSVMALDPLMRQEIECYKIKCNGLPFMGLGGLRGMI